MEEQKEGDDDDEEEEDDDDDEEETIGLNDDCVCITAWTNVCMYVESSIDLSILSTYLSEDASLVRGGRERLTNGSQGPSQQELSDGTAVGNIVRDAVGR